MAVENPHVENVRSHKLPPEEEDLRFEIIMDVERSI